MSAMPKTLRHVLLVVATCGALLPALAGQDGAGGDERARRLVTPDVGALYHVAFRWPAVGFTNPDGSDALTQHELDPQSVDFASPVWHRRHLDAMIDAGLDLVLPVVDAREGGTWERAIEALLVARERIVEAGGRPPRVALHLDLSDLVRGRDGAARDLRNDDAAVEIAGRILRFHRAVPDAARFLMDDFVPVMIGPSAGAPHDRELFEAVDDRFLKAFGKRLFVIAEDSWSARRPASYRNDAALRGPSGDTVVRVLGPGHDDTRLAGRATPVRHREDGRFYRKGWNEVLLAAPTLVIVDSWNDFRHGTGIAPCREFGDTYVKLTRRFAQRLRDRVLPDPAEAVRLAFPEPEPRPDVGWWTPAEGVAGASFDAARVRGGRGEGLRLATVEDGPWSIEGEGEGAVVRSPGPGARYLYFGIADEFVARTRGAFAIEVDVLDGGDGSVALQYDSWDRRAAGDGAYRAAPEHRRSGARRRRTLRWEVDLARFANRQNGGADFRLALRGETLDVFAVRLARLARAPEDPTLTVR